MLLGLFGMRAVCSRLRGNTPRSLSSPCLSLLCHPRGGGNCGSTGGPLGLSTLAREEVDPKKTKPLPNPLFFNPLCAFGCKPSAQSAQFTSSYQCWEDGDLSGFDFSNFLPRQPILLIANETMVYFCIKKKKKKRKEKSIFFSKTVPPFSF